MKLAKRHRRKHARFLRKFKRYWDSIGWPEGLNWRSLKTESTATYLSEIVCPAVAYTCTECGHSETFSEKQANGQKLFVGSLPFPGTEIQCSNCDNEVTMVAA